MEGSWLFTHRRVASSRSRLLNLMQGLLLFTANNSKVTTAMSNAQERQRSALHFLIQLHCEKTSKVDQFKGRFSDFISNFLPFVVSSWSLNNAWNLFLFYFTSSAWKTWRGRIQCLVLSEKVKWIWTRLLVLLCQLVKGRLAAASQLKTSPNSFRNGSINTLILAPWHPFRTSDLQNWKITNLFCLTPVSLWLFVTAAMGNSQNLLWY